MTNETKRVRINWASPTLNAIFLFAFLLVVFILFYVFGGKVSEKEQLLIGSGNKIWYLRFNNGLGKRVTYMQFQFLKNHTYIKYDYDLRTKKREIFNDLEIHPCITPPKRIWRFHNDDTLEFGEDIKRKIIYMTQDSFALESKRDPSKLDTSIYYVVKE